GTSRSKAPDIVHDVADEEGPPDNKSQEYGQGRAYLLMLIINRSTPAEPVRGQYSQADNDKILFKIEKAHRLPMPIPFQNWLNVDLELKADDRAEKPGG